MTTIEVYYCSKRGCWSSDKCLETCEGAFHENAVVSRNGIIALLNAIMFAYCEIVDGDSTTAMGTLSRTHLGVTGQTIEG